MYSSLPKNEKAFDIDLIGEDTGLPYKGQFVCKCLLNISEKHALELEKTRLQADYANPSSGLAGIAISLATIRTKIISGPDWWTNSDRGASVKDENVIFRLYAECNRLENEWRAALKKQAEEAQKGNVQKES